MEWSSGGSNTLQLACKQELLLVACECIGCLPEEYSSVFVCVGVHASVCAHKASVHNVHKPVRTQCMCEYLTACMPAQTFQPMCGVCVSSILQQQILKKRSLLWHFPHVAWCVVRPSSVSEETDCSSSTCCNPTVTYTIQDKSCVLSYVFSYAFCCKINIAKK